MSATLARKRTPSKSVADTQDGWLLLYSGGMSIKQIARDASVSISAVEKGIIEARRRKPDHEGTERPWTPVAPSPRGSLVPFFGSSCKPLALLTCEDVHPGGPIPRGSRGCCMVGDCHQSGIDHYRLMRSPHKDDPKPEPKVAKPVQQVA